MDQQPTRHVPVSVLVQGDPQTGKRTFIHSMLESSNKENGSQSEVVMRDFNNNCTFTFKFTTEKANPDCCIALFDLTDYESFMRVEAVVDSALRKRYKFVYLIGNKLDLVAQRAVKYEDALDFSQSKGISYSEVSSLKRKNIELVLKMLRAKASKLLSENQLASVASPNNEQSFQAVVDEDRIISVEDRVKAVPKMINSQSQDSSRLNTLRSINLINMETAHFENTSSSPHEFEMPRSEGSDSKNKRQLLSQILDSQFYGLHEEGGPPHSDMMREDIPKEEHADEQIDYDEDKQLLKSLEKRFRALEDVKAPRQQINLLEELSKAIGEYKDEESQSSRAALEMNLKSTIDVDIRRTEESLKEMNQRFERLKKASPNLLDRTPPRRQQGRPNTAMMGNVLVFASSLYTGTSENAKARTPVRQSADYAGKSRNPSSSIMKVNQTAKHQVTQSAISFNKGQLTTDHLHRDRPVLQVRIKLKENQYVNANVYKDDTAQTVADRVFRLSHSVPSRENKDKRHILAAMIETQINAHIYAFKEQVEAEQKEYKKQKLHSEQLEREKRLHQASQQSIASLNTAKRVVEKEDKRAKVIGRLSILVGANKKGDIIVRAGDSLQQLAKNFIASYGLRKEFMVTIVQSLEQLISSKQKRPPSQDLQSFVRQSNSSLSIEEQELNIDDYQKPANHLEVLFRLNFELGEGRSAKLTVREGDDFELLARDFVSSHSLDDDSMGKVLHLIQQTYNMHKDKV